MEKFNLYLSLIKSDFSFYMDDDFTTFLWMFLLVIVVMSPVIHFAKLPGTIIGVVLLSLGCAFFYGYLASYGKPSLIWSEVALGFVVSATFFSFMAFGLSLLIDFFQSGKLNKLYFTIWFITLVSIPSIMYLKNFIPMAQIIVNDINLNFHITYHPLYPIYIEELKFFNSKTKKEAEYTGVYRKNDFREFMSLSSFSKLTLKEQFKLYEFPKRWFRDQENNKHRRISYNSDGFRLSWYSFVDGKYYSDEFPFPMSVHDSGNSSYDKIRYIRNLTLHIFPGGNAVLLNNDFFNIHNFTKISEASLASEKKQKYIVEFYKKSKFKGSLAELNQELNKIEESGRIVELVEEKTFFNWSISVKNTQAFKAVKIVDFKRNMFKYYLDKKQRSALPKIITFSTDSFKYKFFINENQFFKSVKKLLNNKIDEIFNIEIEFNSEKPKSSRIKIINKTQTKIINSWEVYSIKNP